METIYNHPVLTIVFIAAVGFWYAVGKSCEWNLKGNAVTEDVEY